MDYPIHIDMISMDLSIWYFKRLPVKNVYKMMYFLSLKIIFILANSADLGKMLPGSRQFAKVSVYWYPE